MPTLRSLLMALDEAPGTETDICCALHPNVVSETKGLLAEARRLGLVACHYRRWVLTEEGAKRVAKFCCRL